MNIQYYRCPINNQDEVILGLISSSTFEAMTLSPARQDPTATVLKLYRQLKTSDQANMIPIHPIDPEHIPESQRLQNHGKIIEIGYPWGSEFVSKIEDVLGDFNLESYHDPFKEGSDSYGLLIGQSENLWEVAPLLDEREEYCNAHPDDEDAPWTMEEPIVEACDQYSVIWLDTDWKHFEVDLNDFDTLGLNVEYIEPVILSQPQDIVIDKIDLLDDRNYVTINLQFIKEDIEPK